MTAGLAGLSARPSCSWR